jgi:thymidylate kinase
MHYFITVNGFATAGKNTAVDFMRNALADMNIPSIEYSSIEIVRRGTGKLWY